MSLLHDTGTIESEKNLCPSARRSEPRARSQIPSDANWPSRVVAEMESMKTKGGEAKP